jgi:pimeloyl-ACP methyl ester carboxylesterase
MPMQIIVDGMLTHYERDGHGPILLILPGWADTSASWKAVQKNLSVDNDVVVLDIPGFGGSQPPATAWDLDDYSQFIVHFVQKLGMKKLHAIVGHSNGGAMAIRTIGTDRLKAEKLVLLASAGVRAVQQGRKGMLQIVAKTGKVIAKPLPKLVQAKLRARLYTSIGSDMLVAEHMQDTFKSIVADDVQADATHISIPALLVYGDKDTETPIRYGELLHKQIRNSDLQVITGAGHMLHINNPDDITERIRKFLK